MKILAQAVMTGALLLWGFGAQANPLRIGVAADFSGPYHDLGGPGSVLAATMAAEDFGGTVLGRPVEIVSADTHNKADVASVFVRNWFDNEGVEAVADGSASSVGFVIQTLAEEKHKIHINSGSFSSAFSGAACTPSSFHFQPDTRALAGAIAARTVKNGGDTWFFITADYAFGAALEKDTTEAVLRAGGKVLGSVRVPLGNTDYSAYLLQAKASGAKVVGLANAGADLINTIKQAHEFGLMQDGTTSLAGLLVFITDIEGLGLAATQGLRFGTTAYWDTDDGTRTWSRRFMARHDGKPPSMVHALTYSAVNAYLQAVKAAGTADGQVVAREMHKRRINDVFMHDVEVRVDGRVMTDVQLVQVKSPAESKEPHDDFKVLERLDAASLYLPLDQSPCKLAKAAAQ